MGKAHLSLRGMITSSLSNTCNWYALISTLRPRQMAAISQTTFSNVFSRMKILELRLKFRWSLSNWQYSSTGSGNGLAPPRREAIIWTDGGLFYWRVYASLCHNKFSRGWKFVSSLCQQMPLGHQQPYCWPQKYICFILCFAAYGDFGYFWSSYDILWNVESNLVGLRVTTEPLHQQ